ncbi:CAP domain-containing protein [Nosocomiicoccus ampullae]|uniref:LPXTG-motif cell wall-anchored protein n=1 Tax=Nosocomiicoccus ampullae TaxID=489910 RepID=A0A9Q2D1D0_9STAP|nr:CAP domain-containing protein [Nosocomiicoccus ampullae]MBB5176642.1 LPXTG-motif cell wall-anchored protein [Nosocomiicoccus ampullae]QYA46592.1 LPXTG cell wall anchor domain-containing protein [Nosocomiicoccus ampullae]
MTFKKKMLVSSATAALLISGGHLPVSEDITNLSSEFVAKANEVGEDNWQDDEMVDWVNNHRAEQTQPDGYGDYNDVPVENNNQLTDFANWKAQNMAQEGYFTHNTPDGQTVTQQYENRYGDEREFDADYDGYIAENIYQVESDLTQEEFDVYAFNGWRNSKGHNENMLASRTDMGYGSYRHEDNGKVTWYGVQVFADDYEKRKKILEDNASFDESGMPTYHNSLESYDKSYNAEDIDPEKVNNSNEKVEQPDESTTPPANPETDKEEKPGQVESSDQENQTPAPDETDKDDSSESITPPANPETDKEEKPGQVESSDQENQTPAPDETDKDDSSESTTPPANPETDKGQDSEQVESPDQGNQSPAPDETDKDDSSESTTSPENSETDKGQDSEQVESSDKENQSPATSEDQNDETEQDESKVEKDTNGNEENSELDEDLETDKEDNSTTPPANTKDNSKVASEGNKGNSSTTDKSDSKVVDKSEGQSNVAEKTESNDKSELPNTGEAMDQKGLIYGITALFVGLGLFLTGRRRKESK